MKKIHIFLLFSIIMLSGLLTACAGGAGAATSWPGLTVDMDRELVYVANNQHVYAVNLASGAEKWRFPREAEGKISFFAAPALTEDDQLVIGGYDNLLYSIDPDSGDQKWTFEAATNKYIAGPLASGGQIFAPNSDNQLYVLTLTGSIQWQFEAGHDLWATPVSNGGHLYLSSMDHNLYALDKMNGEPVWQIDVGGAIAGSPALGPDGILYVGTFGNQLIALDSADGREVWRADSENWVWSGPTLDGETLYFGDLSGTLYSLNTADGSQRWQVQPDSSDERAISDSPLVVEDTVYFVTDGGALWAIDKETGNTRWSKTVEARLFTSPEIAGDTILIATVDADAILYAFDLNGVQKWQFVPAK